MGWTWDQLQATPDDVVDVLYELLKEKAADEARRRAVAQAKRRR